MTILNRAVHMKVVKNKNLFPREIFKLGNSIEVFLFDLFISLLKRLVTFTAFGLTLFD